MKIAHLLNDLPPVFLSNQEKEFVNKHDQFVSLMNLNEQELWMVQNLIRKGVYTISKDNIVCKNTNDH